jgi:hypothetical protein
MAYSFRTPDGGFGYVLKDEDGKQVAEYVSDKELSVYEALRELSKLRPDSQQIDSEESPQRKRA